MRAWVLFAVLSSVGLCEAVEEQEAIHAFLDQYCVDCHGPEKQKGDRRFDGISLDPDSEMGIHLLQDIVDQLNLGEMPPSKAEQPGEEEKSKLIAAVTDAATSARETLASTGRETVLRRLNRREYLETVADLFSLDLTAFDPTAKFPQDGTVEHMDNVGDALVTSGYLLDQYLDAADALVEKALGPSAQPEAKDWHFTKNFRQGQELDYSHRRVYNYRYLCVYEVPNTTKHEGGYAYLHEFQEGVPADGYYEVSALAHAKHRDTSYDPAIFQMNFDEPFRLGIVPGRKEVGTLHHPQPIEPQLSEVTVRDGEPEWVTMKVWLNEGQTPRFIFPNGMANCRNAFQRISREYKDRWPKDDPYNGGIVEARRIVLQHGEMPHIRIHEVKIRGPLYEEWPPESQQEIFGKEGFRKENTRDILKRFADRAYRRPATSEEIDRLVSVVDSRTAAGASPRQATKDAIKAAICSPSFLYLAEPGDREEMVLAPHDLASRLSYFLWSTMPDAELRKLADEGGIADPGRLLAQAERLLEDPRSENFVNGFLDGWLNLRSLGDMPPDRDAYSKYYSKDLQGAMKEEVRQFTRQLIEENGPITDYLRADYTFVNRNLAEHYRLDVPFEPAKAHEFQRVALTDLKRRGGLLGMGAVLTVSANGIETSPVVRGVYLLENIMGTPPPPPPDDVPPIDPDVRGATTIRDRLAKHRELATCFECHRKIDPPGFALENFDPVGGWRDRYPGAKGKQGILIDASAELASGEAFENVGQFKRLLLDRKDVFARNLTERLLTYATGRRIEGIDRNEVDRIVDRVAKEGYGMRTLIREVVASEIFGSP